MKSKIITLSILPILGGFLAHLNAQSVELTVDQWDGTIGSAYGYKALSDLPTTNTEVTVDYDTMEGLLDWWFPAANGQGDQLNPPYYSMLGAEAISLEELVANMSGNWRAGAGEPSVYTKFTEGELSLLPGTPLASPEPTGWFGFSWYGNPNGGVESTLALRAEVGAKTVEFVHWLGNGSATGTGQMDYTITLFSADGTELGSASETVMKTDAIYLTVTATITGAAEGDYAIFRSDHTNTYWSGSFLREVEGGGQSWLGYPVDGSGWADTAPWLNYVNVTLEPWVWVEDLKKYTYIQDDSGWIYIQK